MKTTNKLLILLLAFSILVSFCEMKNRGKKLKKESKKNNQEAPSLKNQHIAEMIVGNPNSIVKDRSPLWKDFGNKKFERPFMHGVVGPQWNIPLAENKNGFEIISSPMPKPDTFNRIIAEDLPPKTYSSTAFDIPLRKDVIQTQIPTSVTRTIETSSDPRLPPKRPVQRVNGSFIHGTSSVDPKVVMNFAEKSSKKLKNKNKSRKNNKKHNFDCLKSHTNQALNNANQSYQKSSAILDSITLNLAEGNNHMVLDAYTLNKRENPDIPLYEDNVSRNRRMEQLKRTPAGVRAAHTLRRLN